ncbi:hypothetical protein [Polyangium jinanense]|uniref:Uncharacterized protein n=1 Tax=Polyangium jinanense TaxID=2829994 RepID=A0A9X3X1P8_9BACT|nr:hypothetical protein [Polyangium jinanense]MDC3953050.1 hypothetical protein [Polyangium jinanense]MDC3980668.1 hypothetical protein [Polyangium jinanense]
MKRRGVLKAGVALAVTPLSFLREGHACDGHGNWETSPPPEKTAEKAPVCERLVARIGRNHGHAFTITIADVLAGVDKTFDLTGTSGHRHTITVTAADFKKIGAGQIVRLASTREGGHIHRLFLECAPAVDPPERVNACEIEVAGKDEHEFVLPDAHVKAKVERTYNIQGLAGHEHSVTVTAADFEDLLRGKQVKIPSSRGTDGHNHLVFIRYPRKA